MPNDHTGRGGYVPLTALLAITGLTAGIAGWLWMPGHPWTAIVPLLIGAVAFLKLVHRLVKPPRTGVEER